MPGRGWSGIGRRAVIALPFLWLLGFFLIPFAIIVKLSFSTSRLGRPPYVPSFSFEEPLSVWWEKIRLFTTDRYAFLASDSLYAEALGSSLWIAATATLLLLLIGFPIAYAMARAPKQWRLTLVMLVILPFWTSFLIRVYAWKGILQREGYLNELLLAVGIIDQPLTILTTNVAVYIGLVYAYLPFMVLPLYATLERLDETLLEAAADLGATPVRAFWRITVPLSIPGVVAGSLLVFIPCVGEFVVPDLLGGSSSLMIGQTLWAEFFNNRDWPLAAAVAVVMILVVVVPIVIFQNQQQKLQEGR